MGDTTMERKYIALALIGLVGCAALLNAGIIGVEPVDGYSILGVGNDGASINVTGSENGTEDDPCPCSGPQLRNQTHNQWRNRVMEQRGGMMHRHQQQMEHQHQNRQMDVERTRPVMGNYLNLTRLEGTLAYDNSTATYTIDTTVLYLGGDSFLSSLARSDYDGDGTYEHVGDELQGLADGEVVVNGLLDNDTLYVSHVNGIWLRMPRERETTGLSGVLECSNGSYTVAGTRLLFRGQRVSRSDIDGDGSLERLHDEFDGLVGEEVTVDGTSVENGLLVVHVNGIWIR